MKNNCTNRRNILIATLAAALLLFAGNTATAGCRQDTLIAGEGGSLIISATQQGSTGTLQLQHTFHGLAVIHLSLRATDSLGKVTFASINTRGYSSHPLTDDACSIPAGTRVEVLSATIQFSEYGEQYELRAEGDRISLSKGGRDYAYARRYELRTPGLIIPAGPLAPQPQSPDPALTIR